MAAIGTLAVNIVARTAKFSTGIMRAQRLSARMGVSLAAVGAAATATGVALLRTSENINRAMTKSLAIMSDVSDTMRKDMVEAANRVAKETEASTAQAAQSYFYLASAGLSAEQSLKAMPVVAKFAQAGNFDLALATDLATDAQSALGLASKDTETTIVNLTRVTDVLVKANTLANASVQQFSESLTNGAAAAMRLVNKDVEEGVAVLAAYADQGIKGAEAGTAFGIVMRDLQTKALQNKTAFRAAGVAVFDASGKMNNLADIVEDLEGLLSGLSDAQKKSTLLQLGFSDKSVKYIQTLIGTSDKIREYEKNLRNAGGTAADVAAKSMTDLQRATAQLAGAWDKLAISFGNAAEKLGVFKGAAEAAEGAAIMIDKAVGGNGTAASSNATAKRLAETTAPGQMVKYIDWFTKAAAEPFMPTSTEAANPDWSKTWQDRIAKSGGVAAWERQQNEEATRKVLTEAVADGMGSVFGMGRRASMQVGRGFDAFDSFMQRGKQAAMDRAAGNLTMGLFGTPSGQGANSRAMAHKASVAELEARVAGLSPISQGNRQVRLNTALRKGSAESEMALARSQAANRQKKREEEKVENLKAIRKATEKANEIYKAGTIPVFSMEAVA